VSWLVRRYVAGRTDITLKAREGYEWAIPHIGAGIGAIPIARLDRENVADWIEGSPLEAGDSGQIGPAGGGDLQRGCGLRVMGCG